MKDVEGRTSYDCFGGSSKEGRREILIRVGKGEGERDGARADIDGLGGGRDLGLNRGQRWGWGVGG